MRLMVIASLFLVVSSSIVPAQTTPWWSPGVADALVRAGSHRPALIAALTLIEEPLRPGMAYLIEHMPDDDLKTLEQDFLLTHVRQAYAARARAPWGASLPDAVFLDAVLPYANVNEKRELWRARLADIAWELVADAKTPGEAAQKLNAGIFNRLSVRYSTQRKKADQAPSESISSGLASCTGLSILLSDACRTVAVPARLAGIPRWPNKSGNHTWVEVFSEGEWAFLGAAEPGPLNQTWFQRDASLAKSGSRWNAIYAVSYAKTGLKFPLVWDLANESVSGIDVSHRYVSKESAPPNTGRLMVRVRDKAGHRRAEYVTVKAADAEGQTYRGVSRDESFDLNDFLSFDVASGAYTVSTASGSTSGSITVAAGEERLVDLTHSTTVKEDGLSGRLKQWFEAKDGAARKDVFTAEDTARLVEDEKAVRALAFSAYREAARQRAQKADFEKNLVRFENYESPYVVRTVGEKPPTGWGLVIAMHGGGGAPKRVNDSQWEIMQRYYRDHPENGGYLYLALRAPNDSWNGFYDLYVYPLLENLVRQFLVFSDVNPDKVFLMGYSHGGYGAFAIGPKIPYRFAAIHSSAAAPTDGQSSPVGLRNTVFTYMVGEMDTAYGRRTRCEAFAKAIAELRGERTDIYPLTFEFKPGLGHGGLPDRDKLATMMTAVRNPTPTELTWAMTDSVVRDHFWLHVKQPVAGGRVDARIDAGILHVTLENVDEAEVLLDRRLLKDRASLGLLVNGKKQAFDAPVSLEVLCETLAQRGDPLLAFTRRLRITR